VFNLIHDLPNRLLIKQKASVAPKSRLKCKTMAKFHFEVLRMKVLILSGIEPSLILVLNIKTYFYYFFKWLSLPEQGSAEIQVFMTNNLPSINLYRHFGCFQFGQNIKNA